MLPGGRNHWFIENKLHWTLDVHFREDNDQKSERKSTRCFALFRRIALNVIRTKSSDTKPGTKQKISIRRRIRMAAMSPVFIKKLLV